MSIRKMTAEQKLNSKLPMTRLMKFWKSTRICPGTSRIIGQLLKYSDNENLSTVDVKGNIKTKNYSPDSILSPIEKKKKKKTTSVFLYNLGGKVDFMFYYKFIKYQIQNYLKK